MADKESTRVARLIADCNYNGPSEVKALTLRIPTQYVNSLDELAMSLNVSRHELLVAMVLDSVDDLIESRTKST